MARLSARARVRLAVGILRNGSRETAYIEDVSVGGLKLTGLINPVVGQVLRIHAKGAIFDAEIRWVRGNSCGLRYLDGQSAGDLRRFLSVLPRLTDGKTKSRQVFQELGAGGTM
ncbi:MAG: PilZ domain-containing protein [Natronohydrobacter sp.]|nr:PilZ domain-containing protein [Natronohydrobacter sp.]